MGRPCLTWRKLSLRRMLELLSSSELIDLMLTTSDETIIIERIFKCSRMPYTDRERKEIVEEIVRRQAHRMLKVYLTCLIMASRKCILFEIIRET